MWPRKYVSLNFAILECSLDVWIVNKIVFAAPELCESALPNPKFLLHCRKWRNINLSWRKFQTSISPTLGTQNFWVKTYKRDRWNLPNILAYISGIFDGFFKAGLVPLSFLLCERIEEACSMVNTGFFIRTVNEAFQRKLDHQMSLHANVPKVFCAVVSNVAQAIGKARGFWKE